LSNAKSSGDGFSSWTNVGPLGFTIDDVVVGDFNNDGYNDLLRTEEGINGEIGKWLCAFKTSSTFNDWIQVGSSDFMMSDFGVGDFDGNGYTDLFIGSSGKWRVVFNSETGFGNWVEVGTSSTTPNDLLFLDLDGDGDTDIFRSNGTDWYASYSRGTERSFTSAIPTNIS
jgi:hypothetical protein